MSSGSLSQACQAILDRATKDAHKLPGAVFVAIDRHGNYIATAASGKRSMRREPIMDTDTIFWIASCTKLLTAIICMQLVEEDTVKLDDHNHLYKYCPELKDKKVLRDDGSLVEKKEEITLRKLLTHTAGFGYEFFNDKLLQHYGAVGVDVFDGVPQDYLGMPLVNQPGSRWEYGINLDWAGFYAERVTGERLNDLMRKRIFDPLGLKNINMFPTPEMKRQLASVHQHWPGNEELVEIAHPMRAALADGVDPYNDRLIHSGGAGCFATPAEYAQVLATLVNDGVCHRTGARILKSETIDHMFTNQIPQFPDFGRQGITGYRKEYSNDAPDLYPQEGNPPQGWGLSFQMLTTPGPYGRSAGSVNWSGIANCHYWMDREKGVAGMIAAQVLPFGDLNVLIPFAECEVHVYKHLAEATGSEARAKERL